MIVPLIFTLPPYELDSFQAVFQLVNPLRDFLYFATE